MTFESPEDVLYVSSLPPSIDSNYIWSMNHHHAIEYLLFSFVLNQPASKVDLHVGGCLGTYSPHLFISESVSDAGAGMHVRERTHYSQMDIKHSLKTEGNDSHDS